MKRFRDFKVKPVLITAEPSHGNHARKKPVMITALPTHGKHSSRKLNESSEFSNVAPTKKHEWINDKPSDLKDIPAKIKTPDLNKRKGFNHIKKYSTFSASTNKELIHQATKKSSVFDTEDYSFFNEHERSDMKKEHASMVKGVDKFINDHPPLEHDIKVYHGTSSWHPGEESSKHPEGHIHLPGYTSTSLSKRVADNFAGGNAHLDPKYHKSDSHILEIHLKKGQKGVYIGSHSHHPDEREFLMPRDTKLKIHPKPTVIEHHLPTHQSGWKETAPKKVHVWKAEVI